MKRSGEQTSIRTAAELSEEFNRILAQAEAGARGHDTDPHWPAAFTERLRTSNEARSRFARELEAAVVERDRQVGRVAHLTEEAALRERAVMVAVQRGDDQFARLLLEQHAEGMQGVRDATAELELMNESIVFGQALLSESMTASGDAEASP